MKTYRDKHPFALFKKFRQRFLLLIEMCRSGKVTVVIYRECEGKAVVSDWCVPKPCSAGCTDLRSRILILGVQTFEEGV